MKLTKTQQEILDEIKASRHGATCVIWGYRTGRKNGRYGDRRFNAAIKLRDAGIVEFRSHSDYIDCRQTYSDHWHEIVIVLAQQN